MKRAIRKVIRNKKVGEDYYLLEIEAPEIAVSGNPGQFVHIKISENDLSHDPLLRRPFSLHDSDRNRGIIKLVYRIVGRGTELMTDLSRGDKIDILGPLGQGFNTNYNSRKILIIGGGMGIVPLYFLTKEIMDSNEVMILLGGNSTPELQYFVDIFSGLNVGQAAATIDGSIGCCGTVIDLWKELDANEENLNTDFLYSCGPEVMLEKIQKIAENRDIKGQISLEEKMGCGIGVCLSCVCETESGHKCLCKEGPVLSLNEVKFK